MKTPSTFATTLANRLDESLQAISALSQVLIDNGGRKNEPDGVDTLPLIDLISEAGLQTAIKIIADMAHRDMCELATDLEIPYE